MPRRAPRWAGRAECDASTRITAEERKVATTDGYAHPAALVETAWVADHRRDAGLRLVEVDGDAATYDTGHIPGAVGWHWRRDLQRRPSRDIPTREEWEALLCRAGIANETRVVLYGDDRNAFAAFAYWLFKLHGHADVALMNGGRVKWLAEGREVTTEATTVAPAAYRVASINLGFRAFRDDIAASLGGGTTLVDVRSPKEYSGELLAPENLPQEGAQRGGHIPGARNVPWASAVAEDGTFKSAAALRTLCGGKGIVADRPTIAYCRIGERSAHTWFVLAELLGHPNVRNYDGGWTEWGSLIGAPIER
jgi:thiosulfate/3-mercaptopyruvate sulfurtransferase